MQLPTLEFEQDNSRAGYRLHRLEVLNWGTFDQQIWTMEPGGHTSLLTGANGSGKSTLVDALLTLLVPTVKRNYNLASGSDSKRERSERTYMFGAFGNVKQEDGHRARTRFLRDGSSYSVLLAHFFNEGYGEHVTLATVFWSQNDAVRKFFAIAPRRLTIESDFNGIESISNLKARLRSAGVETFESFSDYSSRFRRAFGLRSEKALDLFNQTVTIKAIGDLNDFIRTHMLERGDVEERIDQLRKNYDNLTRSHDAIRRARHQLEQLDPICSEAKERAKVLADIQTLDGVKTVTPAWFARKKRGFLHARRLEREEMLAGARDARAQQQQRLIDLRKRETDLQIAISEDAVGGRIREIDAEIRTLDEQVKSRRREAQRIEEALQALGLPMPEDACRFEALRSHGRELRDEKVADHDRVERELDDVRLENRDMQTSFKELESELASLRKRKSKIPDRNLQLRTRLLENLNLSERDVPFIGELLKVRDGERRWEGALERLLHGFALCLLVPEEHYERVNRYIHRTDLRGRLVYHRVQEEPFQRVVTGLDPDSAVHKLEIKPDSAFAAWIEQELVRQHNLICCDDLERFRREPAALTETGLIRTGRTRHEKDDRHRLNDRTRYVLGWSNREKVEAIAAEHGRILGELERIDLRMDTVRTKKAQIDDAIRRLDELLRIEHFSDIDWKTPTLSIESRRDEQRRLEASSDRLNELSAQLEKVKGEVASAERESDVIVGKISNLERDLEEVEKGIQASDAILSAFREEEIERYAPEVEKRLGRKVPTLETIEALRDEIVGAVQNGLERKREQLSRLDRSIEKRMQQYLTDYPESGGEVDASVDALPEFERMHARIARDDLPRHEKRFKELLDVKVVTDIAFFSSRLEAHVKDINEKVARLNESLHAIEYTPATYIQLNTAAVGDREIRDFKGMLRDCVSGVIGTDEASNEARFQKIKSLIARFDEEPRWRAKVTDVRNWLDFSASERYREDDSEKSYYSDSSGRSGGQKAKLAYTILASAIAFQFGLDFGEPRSKSLRFVVIDEAFSRSDEINARYAMALFEKLDLQLLVVSPLDKTHVVEPFIRACHFVTNTQEEDCSKVFNLTIEEYHEQKRRYRHRPVGI